MGVKEVKIYLDNQFGTYYPGQTIYGTAEIILETPKKIRGVNVRFKGEAHTEWAESKDEQTSDGKTESTNTMHTGHEEYFHTSFYIMGSNSGNSEVELEAGSRILHFNFTLPQELPSSFEGPFGYIRYTVRVILDRPMKFDIETKMPFTVVNVFDLNLNPSYKEPVHIQIEKTFCCFCCTSAPLSIDVRSPVSGYVPGQFIPVRIDVENKSNVQVHLVKIFISRVVTYKATSPTNTSKKTKDIVLKHVEGPAPAGTTKNWYFTLQVPPAPPSDLVHCNIIDLDYEFKVDCVVSGMHLGMKAKKYIAIGTVPLLGLPGQPLPPDSGNPTDYIPNPPVVMPVSPPSSGGEPYDIPYSPSRDPNLMGWSTPTAAPADPPYQALYPTLTDPVYEKYEYASRTLNERGESKYVKVCGSDNFAPCYPTYPAVKPPQLPQ